MQQKEFTTHVLPNGLRLIHAWMPRTVSHCALVIQAGTRDEGEGESGLAHFIEHVLFKGTHARKAFHILNRMESVGGEVNAYTTKEETWITSSQRTEHTERALELIADIAFNSVFPEGELEKERDVILDEIASVEDQPGDVIFEDFESRMFAGHPLSRRILGEADVVKSLTRSQEFVFHYVFVFVLPPSGGEGSEGGGNPSSTPASVKVDYFELLASAPTDLARDATPTKMHSATSSTCL